MLGSFIGCLSVKRAIKLADEGNPSKAIFGDYKIMLKTLIRLLVLPMALTAATARAEPLEDYVTNCKLGLLLSASTTLPALNCNDGVRFAFNPTGGLVNDFLGYKKISSNVDLTFACRWLQGTTPQGFATAASLELIIHNRDNGGTCFFAARSTNGGLNNGISTKITSLTAPDASSYWMLPDEVNAAAPNSGNQTGSTLKCVGCHVAGPYIASQDIAPYLAQFGLLNNLHPTYNGDYHVITNNYLTHGGHNVPNAFDGWEAIKDGLVVATGCTQNCHAIASKINTPCPPGLLSCPVPGITGFSGQLLIPGMSRDRQLIESAGLMPPTGASDFRWMNIDIPDDPNTTGDVEDFGLLKSNGVGRGGFQNQNLTCETFPAYTEARVVGSATTYKSNEYTAATVPLPDHLERFDQTGLICRNASQASGMCSNYAVRFICFNDQLSVYNHLTGRVLTIANPDSQQIRWAKGQPSTPAWYGSQTWHVASVNDGTHYDYVRFRNDWLGVYLNADDSLLVSVAGLRDDWTSEKWVMEHVPGTHYVRFRNLWKPGYLTMVDSSDYSGVKMQPLSSGYPDLARQEWELK